MVNQVERLKDDIEYLTEEEDLHLALRDTFKQYSDDYNHHQRLFGIYFRARIRATRELEKLQSGEAIGHG